MVSFRKCVACGEMKIKDELFRVVKTGNGFVYDSSLKMQGRGAYICRDKKCLDIAKKKKAFARSFHQAVNDEAFMETMYEALNDSF